MLLLEPEKILYPILLLSFTSATLASLIVADVCALVAFSKVDGGNQRYGWSLIVPWAGMGPAACAIFVAVILYLQSKNELSYGDDFEN